MMEEKIDRDEAMIIYDQLSETLQQKALEFLRQIGKKEEGAA